MTMTIYFCKNVLFITIYKVEFTVLAARSFKTLFIYNSTIYFLMVFKNYHGFERFFVVLIALHEILNMNFSHYNLKLKINDII